MKLFHPSTWFASSKGAGGQIAASTRESQAMGPWGNALGGWVPTQVNPWLLEAIREAIPIIDGAIDRLVTFDGMVEIQGGNDRLVATIQEWAGSVRVNDAEYGLQAFYASQSNELYEQGHTLGEFVIDARARDVTCLRVADSKGVIYVRQPDGLTAYYRAPAIARHNRPDGLDTVESLLRNGVRAATPAMLTAVGFVELPLSKAVYAANSPEADGPYGTSVLRSLPFVTQILLKMHAATGRSWDRFGDPPFHVHYKTKNRSISADEIGRRAKAVAADLATAMAAKTRGNSVDLATAAGSDDEITVQVIGAEGEALTIEAPARHLLEQIVAKLGVPPWLLGLQWSIPGGVAEQQANMALQESVTRFRRRRPGLTRVVAAMLRARGLTWRPGDWEVTQSLPNLAEELKRAQAGFLRAQTALMLSNSGQPEADETGGIDNNLRSPRSRSARTKGEVADEDAEPWSEPDPKIPAIAATGRRALLREWSALADRLLDVLGLGEGGKAVEAGVFEFRLDEIAPALAEGEAFAVRVAAESGPLTKAQLDAWMRGRANAADDIGVRAAIDAQNERIRRALSERGLQLVRGGVGKEFRDKILAELTSGQFDGLSPTNVARALRKRFGDTQSHWKRLVNSEVAEAQARGKLALQSENGLTTYDYVTVGDDIVSEICRANAAGGPYEVSDPAGKIPVRDSHPECRCTVRARLPAD